MVIRVCILSSNKTSMSIGGLNENYFSRRMREESKNIIIASFILNKPNTLDLHPFNVLCYSPSWLLFLLHCLKNLKVLMNCDIYIAPDINMIGAVISILCKIINRKSMITIHGHYEDEWKLSNHSKMKTLIFKFGECLSLMLANHFVVNDDEILEGLVKKGVDKSRISIRYLFADTKMFSKKNIDIKRLEHIKLMYKLPEKYILFVGNLNYEQEGFLEALQIFKIVHSVLGTPKLVLVGDSANNYLKSKIHSFIKENNLDHHIILTGKVNHELMPYFYYNAQILLLPAQPPQAGVGRIILEALSMEVPVVTTDIGIFYKVVKNGWSGYRQPLGDIESMTTKVIDLLRNDEERKYMGKNGRLLVQKSYSIDTYMNNWQNSILDLYQKGQ